MLAKALIDEIDRLLHDGKLSQRTIAAQLQVSRGTVAAIAGGRRGLHGKESLDDSSHSLAPLAPPERCPRCGYRVYRPCLVCRHRDYAERRIQLRRVAIAAVDQAVA